MKLIRAVPATVRTSYSPQILCWTSIVCLCLPAPAGAYRDVTLAPFSCYYGYPPLRDTCLAGGIVPIPDTCDPPVNDPVTGTTTQQCTLTGDGIAHPGNFEYGLSTSISADRDIVWYYQSGLPSTAPHTLTLTAGRNIQIRNVSIYDYTGSTTDGEIILNAGESISGVLNRWDGSSSNWKLCTTAPSVTLQTQTLLPCTDPGDSEGFSVTPNPVRFGDTGYTLGRLISPKTITFQLTDKRPQDALPIGASIEILQPSEPDFTVSGPASILSTPGAAFDFTATFAPTREGVFSSSAIISIGDRTLKSVQLEAIAFLPNIDAFPSSIDYGAVALGERASRQVRITNNRTGACSEDDVIRVIELSSPTQPGVFTIDGLQLPIPICPGASQNFSVTFSPPAAGTFNGEVYLMTGDSAGPDAVVSLSGAGVIDWAVSLAAPEKVAMLEPYTVALEIFNPSIQNDDIEFMLTVGSDLNSSWELDARSPLSCQGFLPNRDNRVAVGAGSTVALECQTIHSWNWAPPLDLPGTIFSLVADVEAVVAGEVFREEVKRLAKKLSTVISLVLGLLDYAIAEPIQHLTYTVRLPFGLDAVDRTVTVEVPFFKKLLLVDSMAFGISSSSWSAAALAAGCAPSNPAARLACPAAAILTYGLIQSVYTMRQAAIDPRDDFSVITNPQPLANSPIENLPPSPERDLAELSLRLNGVSDAFFLAYVRYLGAIEARDYQAATKQLGAAKAFHDETRDVVLRISRIFPQTFDKLFSNDPILTVWDPNVFESEEFTQTWNNIFSALGISLDDRLALKDIFANAGEAVLENASLVPEIFDALIKLKDFESENFPDSPDGAINAEIDVIPKVIDAHNPPELLKVTVEFENTDQLDALSGPSVWINEHAVAEAVSEGRGDWDGDGTPDRVLTFRTDGLMPLLSAGDQLLTVSGELPGGTFFSASRLVNVTDSSDVDLDGDGDGISDDADACPGTPGGSVVDAKGCSVTQSGKICSVLGNDPKPSLLDQDVFEFHGEAGNSISITLEKDTSVTTSGDRASLILKQKGKLSILKLDRSDLPNQVDLSLPITGTYQVIVGEEPQFLRGKQFIGHYCLNLDAPQGALETVNPTAWVE